MEYVKKRGAGRVWAWLLLWLCCWLWPERLSGQGQELTPIYQIQGEGAATLLEGRVVDSFGVVTAVRETGFFLQDPTGDGRAETSDGIYVYTRQRPLVAVGDCVRVRQAEVDEFYDKTELVRPQAIEPSRGCAGHPTVLTMLPEGVGKMEPYEGMRVGVAPFEGILHGPTRRYSGEEAEVAVVLAGRQPYVSGGRIFYDEPLEQAQLLYLNSAAGSALPDLRHGDRVRVAGGAAVVDYNFGKYQLLLLPGSQIERVASAAGQPDPAAPAASDHFTVCSYNMNGMGSGSDQYPEPARYQREMERRAETIARWLGGCTVVGLQEAGTPRDAEQLAERLRADYGLAYTATALPGPQSASRSFPLTNALLTRTDRVQILAVEAFQGCSERDYGVQEVGACPLGQYPLFDRPVLAVDLAVQGAWGEPFAISVWVNHWKSKSGDERANLPRRVAQAQQVAGWAQHKLAAETALVVLGDLNDFLDSSSVEALRTGTDPALLQLYAWLPVLDRYSYIYNGASQTLDYLLVSRSLEKLVGEVQVVRVNADQPSPLQPETAGALHSSDHDPLLARIWPQGVGWVAGDFGHADLRFSWEERSGRTVGEAVTDANGEVRFWNLPPGAYQAELQAPAHLVLSSTEVAFTVVSGENRIHGEVRHRTSLAGVELAVWGARLVADPTAGQAANSEVENR